MFYVVVLLLLSNNSCFVKKGGRFFQILWPSHNDLTLLTDFGHNEELAQFVKNNRGSENLMDSEGYVYSKKKANSTKTFWGCASRGKFGCRGSATTEGFRIRSRTEHNHLPPIDKFLGNGK